MKNKPAVRTITRANGYSYTLFKYRRGEFIKIARPSEAAVQAACKEREKRVAAMRLIDDLL